MYVYTAGRVSSRSQRARLVLGTSVRRLGTRWPRKVVGPRQNPTGPTACWSEEKAAPAYTVYVEMFAGISFCENAGFAKN